MFFAYEERVQPADAPAELASRRHRDAWSQIGPRARTLAGAGQPDSLGASGAIRRLARLHDWLSSADNLVIVLFCRWLMWETQFAFAIEELAGAGRVC